MVKNVCITGGSGMIGTALGKSLSDSGYNVNVLSRSDQEFEHAGVYTWDVENKTVNKEALESANIVVHLAGAAIAGKRWTSDQKIKIRNSRIKSTKLLYDAMSGIDKRPSVFVSVSAIGVYGQDTGGILLDEKREKPGDDFLATVTKEWEEEVKKISKLGIRVVILRAGIVLSTKGGALPKFLLPARLGLGAPLASGDQYISWIHIHDIVKAFRFVIENEKLSGIYNAVSPEPQTNREFNKKIARVLKKPFFMPNVPAFILKLVFGEMASTIIGGNKVSSKKIREAGFEFKYPTLELALEDLLTRKK